MKKIIIFLLCLLSLSISANAITNDDVILYQANEKWGLKDQNANTLTQPIYKKMIRIGYHSWLVQAKNNKYGITDEVGNIIVEPKYRHSARFLGKYAKLGNSNDFGLYNEYGEIIIPHIYSNIEVLFGQMFLTYKNYKYGIINFNGEQILQNEYDDIYMPSYDTMRLLYKGEWYEVEQVNKDSLAFLKENKENICDVDPSIYEIVKETGAVSGYSVLTLTDYVIKLFSSVSPAHEQTVDELMLSYGADTLSIFKKLSWIPKYPITYAQKYYRIIRDPNTGPLTDLKNELKKNISY